MTANDPTGALTGGPHTTIRSLPQRIAGGTFPGEDLTEAVAARGERHVEMDGGAR